MESIFIVSTGTGFTYTIQGIFKDKTIATKFSRAFEGATVDEEHLYNEFPKLYRYECTMDLKTGALLETKPCTPSVNAMLMMLDGKTLYAVGETEAEAQYNAETYLKKLRKQSSD